VLGNRADTSDASAVPLCRFPTPRQVIGLSLAVLLCVMLRNAVLSGSSWYASCAGSVRRGVSTLKLSQNSWLQGTLNRLGHLAMYIRVVYILAWRMHLDPLRLSPVQEVPYVFAKNV
jgi:hypothetical protein